MCCGSHGEIHQAFSLHFAYCKWSKTGAVEGLGMRLHYTAILLYPPLRVNQTCRSITYRRSLNTDILHYSGTSCKFCANYYCTILQNMTHYTPPFMLRKWCNSRWTIISWNHIVVVSYCLHYSAASLEPGGLKGVWVGDYYSSCSSPRNLNWFTWLFFFLARGWGLTKGRNYVTSTGHSLQQTIDNS